MWLDTPMAGIFSSVGNFVDFCFGSQTSIIMITTVMKDKLWMKLMVVVLAVLESVEYFTITT